MNKYLDTLSDKPEIRNFVIEALERYPGYTPKRETTPLTKEQIELEPFLLSSTKNFLIRLQSLGIPIYLSNESDYKELLDRKSSVLNERENLKKAREVFDNAKSDFKYENTNFLEELVYKGYYNELEYGPLNLGRYHQLIFLYLMIHIKRIKYLDISNEGTFNQLALSIAQKTNNPGAYLPIIRYSIKLVKINGPAVSLSFLKLVQRKGLPKSTIGEPISRKASNYQRVYRAMLLNRCKSYVCGYCQEWNSKPQNKYKLKCKKTHIVFEFYKPTLNERGKPVVDENIRKNFEYEVKRYTRLIN